MGMPAAQSMMSKVQQRPNSQGQQAGIQRMMQMIQQMQQRGLFSRPNGPEAGANRFMHMGNPQMPQQMMPQPVQQMGRPMFQRPQPQQALQPAGPMPGLFSNSYIPSNNWNTPANNWSPGDAG
jgi:hypothetical protein